MVHLSVSPCTSVSENGAGSEAERRLRAPSGKITSPSAESSAAGSADAWTLPSSADSKYTWVKYSQNANGSNLTDDPTDAIYIGIAYNMESQEESNDPSDYSWTRIKGEDGEDGSDAYTVILGNENISFSVNYNSNTVSSDQSYSSTIQIMQGIIERTDFTIGEVSSANGITVTKNDQDETIIL